MPETLHNAPACTNPAVARCCAAWNHAFQQARAQGKGEIFSAMDAARAYRHSFPTLDCAESVCNFIACVAQGILLGAITGPDGSRLLYAAQLAGVALRAQNQQQPARAACPPTRPTPPPPYPGGGSIHLLFAFIACAQNVASSSLWRYAPTR